MTPRWKSFLVILAAMAALFSMLSVSTQSAQAKMPTRIVSILPSSTEIVYALGLGDRLVADTVNCDYPPAAKNKPHIGDMNVNIEAVVAMRPNLILGDSMWNARDIDRLKELHMNVYAPHPTSFEDVEHEIETIGNLTGAQPRALAVVRTMQAKERAAQKLAARNKRRPKVLALAGYDPLYVSGTGTFVGQIIETAGGHNVVSADGFPSYSKEAAIASMPDIILCDPTEARQIEQDPAWAIVPAVREKHIYSIASDLLDRTGPRLADGLVAVAKIINQVAQ